MPWKLEGPFFWIAIVVTLVVAVGVLAVLHLLPNQGKRYLIVTLTFLGGLFYVLEFFIPPHPATDETSIRLGAAAWNLTETATTVGNAAQIIAAFTFLLGVFNLVRIHGNSIRRRRLGWPSSMAFFVAFLLMTVFAFARDWQTWFGNPDTLPPKGPSWVPLWIWDYRPENQALPNDVYTLLFEGLLRNLDATMFSILAFYIVSAAYRAFRIRSVEAAILMVVALVLMMGQVPLGMVVTNWIPADGLVSTLRIENFSQYVLQAINSPVQRAISFGLGLGALAMALRIWLSLERGTYFGGDS